MTKPSPTISNFGRNVTFSPQVVAEPRTEEEVLEVLRQYKGRSIRAIGRLHSWSEAPAGDDVVIDLRHLNGVKTEQRDGRIWATIGAGCQMKRVLSELQRQAGATTPSVGLITEQAIAGAMSTGTHGSGKNSLSHYASEVRVAMYDPQTGEPVVRTIFDGPELQAARCSLGCLGIILSIGLWARPQYNVEEVFQRWDSLDEVLAAERNYPLQQFYFIPWLWSFFVHHRREVDRPRSWHAPLYRLYCFLSTDVGLHLMILFLVRWWRRSRGVRAFFRRALPWLVIQNWRVVDRSSSALTMEHELFRHIEIEVFVRRSKLGEALNYVKELVCHFNGDPTAIAGETRDKLASLGLLQDLDDCVGTYTHHYFICVRRVLPDDTLVSMSASNSEDCYALSFISYARPRERQGFFSFADQLTRTAAALFEARPHWGKYSTIDSKTAEALYPNLPLFREICERHDPSGRFRSAWANRVVFPESSTKP